MVLVLTMFSEVYGQWYSKKYEVNDLDELTPEQYDLAIHDAKYLSIGSAVWSGVGVGIYFIGRSILRNGLDEDATFIEQLLGNKVVGYGTMGIGIASVAGGIIGTVVGTSRIGMIKSSGRNRFKPEGAVCISPVMLIDQYTGNASPGLTLTIDF